MPEEATVAYTYGGALKRVYPPNLRKTPFPTLLEDRKEAPRFLFQALTDQTLFIFTDRGSCFPLSVGKLNECKPKDRGQQLSALLAGLEDGETCVWMTCTRTADLAAAPGLLLVSKRGAVKRMAAAELDVRSRRFSVMNLKDGDTLLAVLPLPADKDVLLLSRGGAGIRFPQEDVPVQGRVSAGVKGMGLEEGDELILAAAMDKAS